MEAYGFSKNRMRRRGDDMSDEDDYDNSQDDAEGDKSDVGDEFVDHEEE